MTQVFAGLFLVLALASMAGYTLHRRKHSPVVDNLNARIRAWWVMIAIGGLALLAGRYAVIALFAGLSWLALNEFLSPLRWPKLVWAAWLLQYGALAAHSPAAALLIVPALAVASGKDRSALGVLLCVYGLAHAPAILLLNVTGGSMSLMLFVVLIVQASDVLQYIWGKLLGRHKIAPRLSPGKTVEGFVGGLLSATLLGALLFRLTPFHRPEAALLALLLTISGFLSSLVLSAIKRQRGIKDWGHAIPGHGGVLDRVDSLCLSAPVGYYAVSWLA